jgi:hypothetical protein
VISYQYGGRSNSINDYISHVPVTRLLIGKDDGILVERYQSGRTDRDRFTSASMAKSMVAMLLGIASIDNPKFSLDRHAQEFVPGLRHMAYEETVLRDLLHKSRAFQVLPRLPIRIAPVAQPLPNRRHQILNAPQPGSPVPPLLAR